MGHQLRVGYIRVSTAKGEQLAALEKQRQTMESLGVDLIIQDVQSGRDNDRAGYLKLLGLIDSRKVSEVFITAIDRLGRDAADTDSAIAFAAKRKVKINALNGGEIESQTPWGFFMSRMMTSLAEVESRILSLRINDGLNKGRIAKHALRGRAPWGYALTPNKGFMRDPIEWDRANQFLQLLEQHNYGLSLTLKKWQELNLGPIPLRHPRSVTCWLNNPILRGGIGYNRTKQVRYQKVIWDCHEPLITKSQFTRIEQVLTQNKKLWGKNKKLIPRLLTSLCRCASCDHSMVYISGRSTPSLMCKNRQCKYCYKSVREDSIVESINQLLTERADSIAGLAEVESEEIKLLIAQIKHLESLNDPDCKQTIDYKHERVNKLRNQNNPDQTLIAAVRNPTFWKTFSYDELRDLYRNLVKSVHIQAPQVFDIKLHF